MLTVGWTVPATKANLVMPLADGHKHAAAYLDRSMKRPSFARVVKQAAPYRGLFAQ